MKISRSSRPCRIGTRLAAANDLPLIMGDRIQLQQVMLNLVINGIEAMSGVSDGPRELWVSSEKLAAMSGESGADEFEAEPRPVRNSGSTELVKVLGDPAAAARTTRQTPNAERAYVLVSVADSGPGFDLNNVDRLFGAFYTRKPQMYFVMLGRVLLRNLKSPRCRH